MGSGLGAQLQMESCENIKKRFQNIPASGSWWLDPACQGHQRGCAHKKGPGKKATTACYYTKALALKFQHKMSAVH